MENKINKKNCKTLDISATPFDNVAFVFFEVMETLLGCAWDEKSRVSAFTA